MSRLLQSAVIFGRCVIAASVTSLWILPALALENGADVVVVAGQSNAQTAALAAKDVNLLLRQADPGVKIWNGTSFVTLVNGSNNDLEGSQNWGPEAEFAREWRSDNPHKTLYIVKYAVAGTPLAIQFGRGWSPTLSGDLFEKTEKHIRSALSTISGMKPKVRAVLWMQGENDSQVQADADNYKANLSAFETAVRSRWGDENTKLIIGRISSYSGWKYGAAVRAGQLAVARANPKLDSIINTDSYPRQGNALHYTASGVVEMGRDMYMSFIGKYTFVCTGAGC